jgi:hypothetical protein
VLKGLLGLALTVAGVVAAKTLLVNRYSVTATNVTVINVTATSSL